MMKESHSDDFRNLEWDHCMYEWICIYNMNVVNWTFKLFSVVCNNESSLTWALKTNLHDQQEWDEDIFNLMKLIDSTQSCYLYMNIKSSIFCLQKMHQQTAAWLKHYLTTQSKDYSTHFFWTEIRWDCALVQIDYLSK